MPHRFPLAARPLLVPLLCLLYTACSGPVFTQPDVTLQSVQIGGLGLRGGTLLVNLRIVNPNRFALNANQLRYELAMGDDGEPGDTTWIDVAQGVYDRAFSVSARDSATVQIPVDFTYSGLGGAATSILRSGTFDYKARGTVDVRTPLGTHNVPFRRSGKVTLLGLK